MARRQGMERSSLLSTWSILYIYFFGFLSWCFYFVTCMLCNFSKQILIDLINSRLVIKITEEMYGYCVKRCLALLTRSKGRFCDIASFYSIQFVPTILNEVFCCVSNVLRLCLEIHLFILNWPVLLFILFSLLLTHSA